MVKKRQSNQQEQKMQVSQDVRSYALDLVANGVVDMEVLLRACLGYMSMDDVCHMLDLNEMSPRFFAAEEQ
jgi:hypothetical protein